VLDDLKGIFVDKDNDSSHETGPKTAMENNLEVYRRHMSGNLLTVSIDGLVLFGVYLALGAL
jgi:hypothetical protein